MKKRFLLLIMIVCSIFMVVSCGEKTGEVDGFWDKDGDGIADWQQEEITLTYASWQHNDPEAITIESLMVEAFTEKYPNITVEMEILGVQDNEWDPTLISLQEADDLPDVFLVNRLENLLPNLVTADITEYWDNDPDTAKILDSVRDLGLVDGKRYIVPTYFYPQFWIVNLSLLKSKNITVPSYDWTWEDMENIAKEVTDINNHVFGVYGTAQYFYEYPKVIDAETHPYAYGYNGESFDYSSEAYLQAMTALETALNEQYVINSLSADECKEFYRDENADPRYIGKVGIWRQAAWEVKNQMPNFQFEFDVYPAPSGVGMGNTDIAGISSLTEHPEAAYQLLKWMSYSEEGLIRRYELYEEYEEELYISGNNYPYPIVDYGMDKTGVNKIWDSIPYGTTAPGLVSPQFIEAIRGAATQANKEVIGWDAVDQAVGPYFSQILMGESDFWTLRETIQSAANTALEYRRKTILG